MKKTYILLSFVLFSCFNIAAQDSIFIYKDNQVINKYATADIDSITFKQVEVIAEPELTSFSFGPAENTFLYQKINGKIKDNTITLGVPYKSRKLVASFTTGAGNTVTVDGVEQESGVTVNDFTNTVTYTVTTPQNKTAQYSVTVNWVTGLPSITINTVDAAPIVSKEDYIRAYIEIDGKGFYENFADSTRIRGRGNTTWSYPKKPYRLKLDNDGTPFGLAKEKDWVLLANYLDPTHLLNPVAMTIGQMLELPFTNHVVPVVVTLNGQYQGVYTFTEQVERSKTRVNIDKKKGALLELDQYFDEDFKFKSEKYNLPVMVKDPDLAEDFKTPEESTAAFDKIKSDFAELENALVDPNFPNNNYKDLIDIESVVKFLLVFDITSNLELNHPKSTYMHKDDGKKYYMGPIWDFDWAYGYESTGKHFETYQEPALKMLSSSSTGYPFFSRFLDDPAVKTLYKSTWNEFKQNNFQKLIEYIEINFENIREDQILDRNVWNKGTSDYPNKINQFKTWLNNRAGFIDAKVAGW